MSNGGEESVNMRSVMYNMGPKMGSRWKKDEQLKRNLNDCPHFMFRRDKPGRRKKKTDQW